MTQTVLFLCTGNYYRSRFAEILFNHLACERGLPWRADSRGLNIKAGHNVGPISQHTRDACRARNLALAEPLRMPQPLVEEELRDAAIVVAVKEAEHRKYLEQSFPAWANRVRYWHVHDLDAATAETALPEIEAHVRGMIDELSTRNAGRG